MRYSKLATLASVLVMASVIAVLPLTANAGDGVRAGTIGRELSLKISPAPVLPDYALQIVALKSRIAREYAQAKHSGQWATYLADLAVFNRLYNSGIKARASARMLQPNSADAYYTQNSLAVTQQPQTTYYYCGPASTSELLGFFGIGGSDQDSMSTLMSTTTGGTNWSMASSQENATLGTWRTGYPMADALNYKRNARFYYPMAVPYYPTSSDYTNFQNNMSSDIDTGYPIIGDAEEVHDGPRLVGHPNPAIGYPIYHWFTIKGYTGSGANTTYVDSVYNAPAVSWYQSVPSAESTLTSHKITDIIGDRGYVW